MYAHIGHFGQRYCTYVKCMGMSHSGSSSGYFGKVDLQIPLPEEIILESRKQETDQRCYL